MMIDSRDPANLLGGLQHPLPGERARVLAMLRPIPSLALVRHVRRLAEVDPITSVRNLAKRILTEEAQRIAGEDVGRFLVSDGGSPRLRALISEDNSDIRAQVARSLCFNLSPSVPSILARALESEDDPFVQSCLILSLAAAGGSGVTADLVGFLDDEDPRIRISVVQALEACGDPALLTRILPFLEDVEPRVRAVALRIVQAQDSREILRAIDAFLGSGAPDYMRVALYALRSFDADVSLPRLAVHVSASDPTVSESARSTLGVMARLGSKRAAAILADGPDAVDLEHSGSFIQAPTLSLGAITLEARLAGPFAEDRTEAILDAVLEGRRDLRAPLIDRLREETDPGVRATIASALGHFGTTEDMHCLHELSRSTDQRVRANAVEAMGRLLHGKDRLTLRPFLEDPSPRVRGNAAVALDPVESVSSLEVLRRMVSSGEASQGRTAIWAAAAIGTADALDLLADVCHLGDPEMAGRARDALGTLALPGRARDALGTLALPGRARDALGTLALPGRARDALGTLALPGRARDALGTLALPGRARDALGTLALPGRALDGVVSEIPKVPDSDFMEPIDPVEPADTPQPGDRESLIRDLRHPTAGVRAAATRRIAATEDPALLRPLMELLRDEDRVVRQVVHGALRSLILACSPIASPPESAAQGAGFLGAMDRDLMSGGEPARAALSDIGQLCVQIGVEPVVGMLASRLAQEADSTMRSCLVTAISILGSAKHLEILQRCLEDESPQVRSHAIEGLALIASPEIMSQVTLDALGDPDPGVQVAALTAVDLFPREPYLAHLENMLYSEHESMRTAGLDALRYLPIPERWDLVSDVFDRETLPSLYEIAARIIAMEIGSGRVSEGSALVTGMEAGPKKDCLDLCFAQVRVQDTHGQKLPQGDEIPLRAPNFGASIGSGIAQTVTPGSPTAFESLQVVIRHRSTGTLSRALIQEYMGNSENPLTLAYMLESADEINDPDLMERISKLAHSKDRRIRLTLAQTLGKLNHPDVGDHLAFLIADKDPEISQVAAQWLEEIDIDQARAGILRLLVQGEAWALKRAVEIIWKRGRPHGLPLLLESLRQSACPILLEDIGRLFNVWGDEDTLESLIDIYRKADPRQRPLLGQLGKSLAETMGVDSSAFTRRVTASSAAHPRFQGPIAEPSVSHSMARIMKSFRLDLGADSAVLELARGRKNTLGGIAAALGLVLLVLGLSSSESVRPDPTGSPVRDRAVSVKNFSFARVANPKSFVSFDGGSAGSIRSFEPRLEDVEANLKQAFASKGVQSDAIIHILALDRLRIGYRREIARARAEAREGRIDRALEILDQAYQSMEEDHVAGRVALLKAMIQTAREAGRWDLVDSYRAEFKSLQQTLLAIIVEAARNGEIPKDQIDGVLERISKRDENKAATEQAADFLSGRETGTTEVDASVKSIDHDDWEEEFGGN